MRKRALSIVAVPLVALVGTATAVRSPDYLDERPLETATGGRGRAFRDVTWDRAPDSAKKAWSKFLAATPGTWRSQWDRTTEVPLRIWGEGIAVPGSMANSAIAEQAARALLAQHIALLARPARSPTTSRSHRTSCTARATRCAPSASSSTTTACASSADR